MDALAHARQERRERQTKDEARSGDHGPKTCDAAQEHARDRRSVLFLKPSVPKPGQSGAHRHQTRAKVRATEAQLQRSPTRTKELRNDERNREKVALVAGPETEPQANGEVALQSPIVVERPSQPASESLHVKAFGLGGSVTSATGADPVGVAGAGGAAWWPLPEPLAGSGSPGAGAASSLLASRAKRASSETVTLFAVSVRISASTVA